VKITKNMPQKNNPMLRETDAAYFIEHFFPVGITAGFTKNKIIGRLPEDSSSLLDMFDVSTKLCYMEQTHSAVVNRAERDGLFGGDGLFTCLDDHLVVVRTADCMPIVFYSEEKNIAGVVHMGWKPAVGGILDNIGGDLSSFKVFVGVGLRKCCYEVGEEFLAYSRLNGFVTKNGGSCLFDPVDFIRTTLTSKGLLPDNFYDVNICSKCAVHKFPSYRRTGEKTRTLTFIVKRAVGSFLSRGE